MGVQMFGNIQVRLLPFVLDEDGVCVRGFITGADQVQLALQFLNLPFLRGPFAEDIVQILCLHERYLLLGQLLLFTLLLVNPVLSLGVDHVEVELVRVLVQRFLPEQLERLLLLVVVLGAELVVLLFLQQPQGLPVLWLVPLPMGLLTFHRVFKG